MIRQHSSLRILFDTPHLIKAGYYHTTVTTNPPGLISSHLCARCTAKPVLSYASKLVSGVVSLQIILAGTGVEHSSPLSSSPSSCSLGLVLDFVKMLE